MNKLIGKIKQSRKVQAILGTIVIVLLIAGIIFYFKSEHRVAIDNSVISAPIISLTPTASGILRKTFVSEGQIVHKGDALALVGSETITAYADGLITMVNGQLGGTITPQMPVIAMVSTADMRIDGELDENKGLNTIRIGQPISFTVDALPGQTFWGYIDEVSPTARQTQVSFSISSERPTQQFDVYARFDAASHPEIKNGMSAKMVVYTK